MACFCPALASISALRDAPLPDHRALRGRYNVHASVIERGAERNGDRYYDGHDSGLAYGVERKSDNQPDDQLSPTNWLDETEFSGIHCSDQFLGKP